MDKQLLNGKYEILQRIKSGGFSTVYLAKDIKLDMKVVLKKFHKEEMAGKLQGEDKAVKYSIEQEIKKAIHFNHPNIARYFDFFTLVEEGAFDEQTYEVGVMEYISGGSIKEYVDNNGPDSVQAKNAILGVLEGLQYLHDRNIMHRDIKSDNILMSDGVAKIIDFGIAKRIKEAQTRMYGEGEQQSELITTFEYCSPEQIDPYTFGVNETISYGVDVWMFGVLTYYLCTGKFPFDSTSGSSSMEKLRKNILSMKTEQLDWKEVPEFYRSLISKCLTKNASERPSTSELIEHFKLNLAKEEASENRTQLYTEVNKPQNGTQTSALGRKLLYYMGIPLAIAIIFFFGYNYFSGVDGKLSKDELVAFEDNGDYGYTNSEGEIIIPAQYDEAGPFNEGVATVHLNDSILEINSKGEIINMQIRDKDDEEVELVLTSDISDNLNEFIDQFNQDIEESARLSLLRSYENEFRKWTMDSSIFALNDITEASLKAVFLKSLERKRKVKLDELVMDQEKNKIQYAIFSFRE